MWIRTTEHMDMQQSKRIQWRMSERLLWNVCPSGNGSLGWNIGCPVRPRKALSPSYFDLQLLTTIIWDDIAYLKWRWLRIPGNMVKLWERPYLFIPSPIIILIKLRALFLWNSFHSELFCNHKTHFWTLGNIFIFILQTLKTSKSFVLTRLFFLNYVWLQIRIWTFMYLLFAKNPSST